MNDKFDEIIDQLPSLLNQLINSTLKNRTSLGPLPQKGVYVFYENECPIYVGRSNRIKERILEHSRSSSTHNSAPFAFNLAKEAAINEEIDVNKKTRVYLEKDSNFSRLFSEAKERVSRMSVRVIKIDDPVIQTIFEVYASIKLNTNLMILTLIRKIIKEYTYMDKKQATGMAGVYYVAAELSKRGYIALITTRNTKATDLVVVDDKTGKSANFQVKTNGVDTSDNFWLLSINFIYAFVKLFKDKSPVIYIVPAQVVKKNLSVDTAKTGSVWYSISKSTIEDYREGWDIVKDTVE